MDAFGHQVWEDTQMYGEGSVDIVRGYAVMIGGAPFLMGPLERALKELPYPPEWVGYAFSTRESVDEKQADGSVKKIAVFRHRGFVKV